MSWVENFLRGTSTNHQTDTPWLNERLPRVLPPKWMVDLVGVDGVRYINLVEKLSVILSGEDHSDGKRWLHLSLAHGSRIPRWAELVEAKETFLGVEVYAYQVVPPRAKYVNINPYCLHLYSCIDGDPLPDFTRGGNTL